MTPDPFTPPATDDIERTAGASPTVDPGPAVPSRPAPHTPRPQEAPSVAAAPVGPARPDAPPRTAADEDGTARKQEPPLPPRTAPHTPSAAAVPLGAAQQGTAARTAADQLEPARKAEPPLPARAAPPTPHAPSVAAATARPAPHDPAPRAAGDQLAPVREHRPEAAPGPAVRQLSEPQPATVGDDSTGRAADADGASDAGDEAIHTLLWTAATERPVKEVVALVARLNETGEVSRPADEALRAAAVSRPLDEVRQLVSLLTDSGYDVRQAETTLRAAAVGRPIEDVVALVNIIGTDASHWRCTGGGEPERTDSQEQDESAQPRQDAVPVLSDPAKPRRGAAHWMRQRQDGTPDARSGRPGASSALRSTVRWPMAVALVACGLVHLPADVAGLQSEGSSVASAFLLTMLCLACAVWLVGRNTFMAWTAAAAIGTGVLVLHVLAGFRPVALLDGSLSADSVWATGVALLSGVAVAGLAGSVLMRGVREAGVTGST